MDPALLTLVAFVAGVLLVAGAYSILTDLYLRDRSRISRRVDDEFRKKQRDKARKSSLFKNLSELAADAANEEKAVGMKERIEAMIEQAGMDVTINRLLVMAACVGAGLGAIVFILQRGIMGTAAAALLGAAVPFLYVRFRQKRRLNKLMSQLPDAFDLMARVIRAGQTMSQALLAVADEFDAPISAEFSFCYEQQNLGLSPELALRDLARRTGVLEIRIFVLALLVQQQTGGNLAEMLEKLAGVVRERFRLLGKIKALTAEGRFQAAVLLALPPGMFALIMVLNPGYGRVLLDTPTLLVGVFVAEIIGALWIRKIVNFDF
jgi:tight adherence protein B